MDPSQQCIYNLPKHLKYGTQYKPNEIFWGIGVEHETYLESHQRKTAFLCEISEKRKPERYSVNYYSVYKPPDLEQAFADLSGHLAEVPILINSHSFTHCDISGEHRTTYSKQPRPNPKFTGKTLHEFIADHDPYFNTAYEEQFMFDGDSIEFVNLNFYNARIPDVLDELCAHEDEFVDRLNAVLQQYPTHLTPHLPLDLAHKNYPFASHLTNLANYSMFNNSTLHINITLPSQLDGSGHIANMQQFTEEHRNYIRIIQWLEPLWVAVYGAGDIFSAVNPQRFCAGSQRLAVSRYIALGTYDARKMPLGKILLAKRTDLSGTEWYDELYATSAYSGLEHVGLDINFNKHFAHGVELRFMDAVATHDLQRIMNETVYCADFAYAWKDQIQDIHDHKEWQTVTLSCLKYGKNAVISEQIVELYSSVFHMDIPSGEYYADELYEEITTRLHNEYSNGPCSRRMV